jgi:hypothetical protein
VIDLQTDTGRAVYSVVLLLALIVSLICDFGFALGSTGAAVACLLFCTLPLLIALVGVASLSKLPPIAAIIGSGSMVAFIAFLSFRDIFSSRGISPTSIIYEKWWWLYFSLNFIQLILAACLLKQMRQTGQNLVATVQPN